MIPQAYISHWQQQAPWPDANMVEQDLVISRALVAMFQQPLLQEHFPKAPGGPLTKPTKPLACFATPIWGG